MAVTIVRKTPDLQSTALRVMGLDISTKAGVAVLDFTRPTSAKLELTTLTHKKVKGRDDLHQFHRWALYEAEFEEMLGVTQPSLVVVEGYGFASQSLAVSVELGTHFRRALHRTGTPWITVAPTKLKKFVTGKGNGDKNAIMLEAYKRFGIDTADDNQCDAACLAYFGATLANEAAGGIYGLPSLPKPHLDALVGVALPDLQ